MVFESSHTSGGQESVLCKSDTTFEFVTDLYHFQQSLCIFRPFRSGLPYEVSLNWLHLVVTNFILLSVHPPLLLL